MSIKELNNVLEDFKKTLDADVKSLADLHRKDGGKGQGRPGRWLEAITRASIVLLAANLENYIETLICEAFRYLCKNKVRARKYPETYRLWNFRQDVNRRSLGLNDSKNVIELSLKLWSEVRELQEDELKLEILKEEFANPTPKNVDWIMSLLDYKDYLNGITTRVLGNDTSAKSALGEIAQRRNEIAHGDISQTPSIDDVERLSKFSQLFANRIYKDVETKINECLK